MDTVRMLPVSLSLSAAGLIAIALFEGYRLDAYTDDVGVATVGFGSTRIEGRAVIAGDKLPADRALVQLGTDAASFEKAMRVCIGDVPLYPHEWDAYVSLAYNIGSGAFCRSTLVKKLRMSPPDYGGACAEILKWNRAGGRVLAGLVKRRQAEFELCTEGRK